MKPILFAGLMLATFFGIYAKGAEIIGDNYDVTGSGTGFNLGSGVNSGINPPATRLTGSAADGLFYIKAAGGKEDGAHTISADQLQIGRATGSSTLALSSGTGPYDFSTVLNSLAASPALPAVYEIKIDFGNAAAGQQRCSFAISSVAGTANAWDFGIQLWRPTGAANYTLQKRMSIAATSAGAVINSPIATEIGTYPEVVSFVIRVTDAGAEAAPGYNSRIQVSIDGGTTWIYDTETDFELIGWHFPQTSRFIYWDVAGNAGPVTYDNFSLNFISGPTAATRTWTGAGADDNWSTGGNWGGIAPVTGDTLVFNGITRQANVNDIADLIVPQVEFNNGGFSLSGAPFTITSGVTNLAGENTFAVDLNFESTAVKTWGIASGSEIVLNNISTVEVAGEHHILGGGALRLKGSYNIGQVGTVNGAFLIQEGKHIVDGGSFLSRGGYRIGSSAAGEGGQTIITNGGTLSLTAPGSNLRVGDSANPIASRLLIDNSTLTLAGGALGVPYATGASAEVVQNGGTVSGAVVAFSDAGAGTGTYTIQNGTLEPLEIRKDTPAGSASIYFDNATLRTAPGANVAFFAGLDLAEVQSGGLTLEVNSDVTIDQALSGIGSLTKSGFATATLAGANTYSGNTIVQSGKLVFPTTQTNDSTTIQVADGAELGVLVAVPGSTFSVTGATLGGGSFSTLSFDLGSFTTPTAPLMKVGSLSVNGTVTINVANGLQLTPGTIVLVDYDGVISGGFNFTPGTWPPGVTATLVNNTANSSIDLNITATPGFRWTGAINGDWDYATENWFNHQTGSASAYTDGFPAEFLDGAATGIINLTTFVTPSTIVVNNDTLPYVWNGGAITTPRLQKLGTNSLTRSGGEADFIDEIELNAGAFAVSNLSDAGFTSVLIDADGGSGAFVKKGSGILTLSTDNESYDGAIVVQEGILKMGVADSLGSTNGATIIESGATLDLNNIVAPHEPVIVSGDGVNGQGAIIDSTPQTGVAHNLTDVTMVGNTTFGAPDGRWDIRIRAGSGVGPGLQGNGFNLTKVGPGHLSIAAQRHNYGAGVPVPFWQMNLGDVVIAEGALTFAESVDLGNPEKTITLQSGTSMGTFDNGLTNPIVRDILMTDATITAGGGTDAVVVFDGSIQLTGVGDLRPNNAQLIINGPIVGTGSLTVTGSGTGRLYLNGVNTHSGDTTVNSGTLGGNGVIAGNLTMVTGTVTPGMGVGTLTVNGNATLAEATVMELDRSQSPNSDRLSVGGTLTVGGSLTVVLGSGAPFPQAGDVYQLFNKGSAGVFSEVILPDLSALPNDLAWDTSKLYVDGTISVTGTATPPTIDAVYVSDGSLVLSGTGGVEGNTYTVLSSTNVVEPIANWTPIATNTFEPGGSFSYTNNINPGTPQTFFLLQIP